MRRKSILIAVSLSSFALLLGACNEDDKKPASQVAAKVNQEEISVHQINHQLARAQNLTPEQAKEASKQVLVRLVDQELMVQQAIDSKLDRDPRTMQAIDSAKREILARAYLDKLAAALPKPIDQDVSDYYAKHPELFAQRRIYNFNEIVIRAKPDEVLPALQERLGKAKSLAEVGEWLKHEKLPFAANNTTKSAEQLPMELLPRFHQMKEGQIGMIPSRDSVLLVQLVASRLEPMNEKAATPFIQQYLFNQRKVEAVDKELKSLRDKAKIEYVGEFSQLAKADVSAADPEKKPADPMAKTDKAPQNESIDKGIAGLK
jgi:EpsD family peptidyl-prolyl cis-trans isomerase